MTTLRVQALSLALVLAICTYALMVGVALSGDAMAVSGPTTEGASLARMDTNP